MGGRACGGNEGICEASYEGFQLLDEVHEDDEDENDAQGWFFDMNDSVFQCSILLCMAIIIFAFK